MIIRPVAPSDHAAEWLRMRLNLWGGTGEEHIQDIANYFTTPQRGITFVVERPGGGLCGFIEVSLRNYAEGCTTSPVAYIEGWYVDEESRRRTLGTRLVQAAEAWARNVSHWKPLLQHVSYGFALISKSYYTNEYQGSYYESSHPSSSSISSRQ
jgi:aminoglycoside 6'-N-acetyltransferase I